MNKYRVFGHTTVNVVIEVNAATGEAAYDVAFNERDSLTAYAGNGGTDKLIGVDEDESSVSADEQIEYDDIEFLGLADEDDIKYGKCYHFEDCGNESVYELTLVNGQVIYVCEDCDDDYSMCQVCGKVDLSDNMEFANSEDEYKTCCLCRNHDEDHEVRNKSRQML